MVKQDARKLDHATLEAIRIRAVLSKPRPSVWLCLPLRAAAIRTHALHPRTLPRRETRPMVKDMPKAYA